MFEQEYGARLDLRVGIATGEAVAVTEPTREFMVTGEVANLASRLQSAASGILVSAETLRLVRSLVESEALGPLSLKGFPPPVIAHLVTSLRSVPTPRGVSGLSSPVVGRERETAGLRRCAEELARGRGQIVSVIERPPRRRSSGRTGTESLGALMRPAAPPDVQLGLPVGNRARITSPRAKPTLAPFRRRSPRPTSPQERRHRRSRPTAVKTGVT